MVAEGYKETEVGVIPIEWEVVKLEEGCEKIIGGGTPSKDNNKYWNNGTILWATPTEFTKNDNRYISKTILKITKEGLENSSATLLRKGTVIMSSRATIGECKINTIEMTTNQGFISYECNELLNNVFLLYLIGYYKDKIIKVSSGSTFLEVSRTTMRNFKIPLPALKEQEKIADILSTADEKIDAIASQIQKAETLKKGLLQKLLSEGIGHSEFKDSELGKIPESWEVVELGSFSKSISKKNKDNVITDVVSVTKYDGIVNSLEYFNKKVFSDNITTYKIIERNQFAYATIHLDEGSVGFLDIFDIAVLSPMYSVFEIDYKRVDRSYFYSLVKSHKMIKIYEHIGLGSVERRKSISFNIFKKIKIPLPPLEEQKQIAEILSTADEKLEVLRAKKENYEILKKGLLQKLLSGEVRV